MKTKFEVVRERAGDFGFLVAHNGEDFVFSRDGHYAVIIAGQWPSYDGSEADTNFPYWLSPEEQLELLDQAFNELSHCD